MISALAILSKLNEQGLVDFTASLTQALTAEGTEYSPLGGGWAVELTNVKLVLDSLQSLFNQSGTIIAADLATQSTPFIYSTPTLLVNLPNDNDGELTNNSQAPNNIEEFVHASGLALDFSDFKVGDVITLRVDLLMNGAANDIDVELLLSVGESTPSEKVSNFTAQRLYSSAVTYSVTGEITFNIGHANIINNPGHIQMRASGNVDVIVNTFEAFVHAKN
jgi:hypothetical protein